jgi:pimeloyl-ACP methyl ester carboxylesterase
MKASRSEFLTIRGLRYHVRHWGSADAPKLFMLHGWMDVSASFQFVVDCLQEEWHVIAPDWRGFGLTDCSGADTYWFADYIGDLEAIVDHYSPDEAIRLVGHSMGANVSTSYAGVRPQRIGQLVNLEGVGMAASRSEQAPRRIAKWLDELRSPPAMRSYASQAEVAARLQKTNPLRPLGQRDSARPLENPGRPGAQGHQSAPVPARRSACLLGADHRVDAVCRSHRNRHGTLDGRERQRPP